MKKRIALIITLILVLALTACSLSQIPTDTSNPNTNTGNTNTNTGNDGDKENVDQGNEGSTGGDMTEEENKPVDPDTCKHIYKIADPRVEPTCQETGLSVGSHCGSCGVTIIEQKVLPKIDHKPVANQDVLPSCKEVGYTGGTHCEMCDEGIDPPTVIPATGHTEVSSKDVAPTCTEVGYTGGTHCYVCGDNVKPAQEVPALGHTEVVTPGYAATCTKEGLSDGTHCDVCDEVITAQTVISKAPHNEVANEDILPSCEAVGYTGGTHCGTCNMPMKDPTTVPAKGHTEVQRTEDKLPTCTEEGYSGGTYCKDCDKTMSVSIVIPAKGHTEVSAGNVAATCTEDGYTGATKCSVCNEIINKGTVVPAKGHTEAVLKGYEPTCSREGLSDGKYCTVCNETTFEQLVLSTTSHAEVITPAIAPTCQSVGYTESRKCSVCNKVTKESTMIPKGDHTPVVDKAVEPTCSETGLTEGSHCSVCNTTLVAQAVIAKNSNHVYPDFVTVTKSPTTSSTGSGTFTCTKCSQTETVSLPKLVFAQLTKDDVYSVETDIYNAAYDNRWKVVDGTTTVSSIYSSGDWFGAEGDILTITLKQEMALSNLKVYTAGNYTFGTIRVKDSSGKVTASKTICANGAAYGGDAQEHTIYNNSTAIKAYTIEIEIGTIKGVGTFKVSEVVMRATPLDTRTEHTHNYREFIETSTVATCQVAGVDVYECFCGKQADITGSKSDHSYDTLKSELVASCNENGKSVYACACGATKTVETEAKGHIFYKFVNYSIVPTTSTSGLATYKCISCNAREERKIAPLPIEEIYYLRVDKIENGKVTLKLNVYGDRPSLEVRYSTSEINEDNYLSAQILDATIKGEGLVTITIDLSASLDKAYYVAVKPYEGGNYGEMAMVRVGGNLEIPIDYSKAQVYHGEVINSFRPIFDDDITTKLGKVFPNPGEGEEDISGSPVRPIVDLQYMHYVSKISLYYAEKDYSVTVRWSDKPLDFMSSNSEWNGYEVIDTIVGWNDVEIGEKTRYIQVIFTDGESPYEMTAYGYQVGEGDEISTEKSNHLPTVDQMIGMCGFVAGGGGNTPIDSVICTTVLREYHNFGWSYTASNYGKKASFFTGGWMGNFDNEYKAYKEAGINVIPCIQWSLGNGETISYKVGGHKLPVYDSEGKLIRASFWERFDPHTYFVYADNMFAFAARYGTNTSAALLDIAKEHCSSSAVVGMGTIEWIEMGNEPDGGWNGIHNYLSAYQLAAATSAAYDGHCSTMVSPVAGGYHLGGKNADPNMNFALAGVSGVSNEYITAMIYWMKANRNDGDVAFDAFNVHHYMSKAVTLPNGSTAYVGISPEEAKIDEVLADLIELRDKHYPDKEVWITEFGWDTNQSYATSTSAHAYAEYTGRQVQAMWLTRAYLIFSSIGIDKADMYMCEDVGVEENSVGKYGTCGVIGFEYDENGELVEVKKDSYYYLYTLKNTLDGYSFDSQVEAYDENVMIYKYKTAEGKEAYAVWCKTSDGTKSNNYQLRIDAENATLVEAVYGDIDGVQSGLVADEYGYVSVDVSENPVYVIVD